MKAGEKSNTFFFFFLAMSVDSILAKTFVKNLSLSMNCV